MMNVVKLTLFCFVLGLIACNTKPDRPDPMLDPAYVPDPVSTTTPVTPVNTTTSGTTAGGTVHHYLCPNGCGGGPSAGTCPTCGTAYTHNQAWHNQTNNTTIPSTQTNTTTTNPTATATPTPPTEPAQNAAGVWHYTCNNGCAGGAGSAVACATCGQTLVHNTLYHQ